jgi:hypothetical protein
LLFIVPRLPLPNEAVNVWVDNAVGLVTDDSVEMLENDAGRGTGIGGVLLSSCGLLLSVLLIALEAALWSEEYVPESYQLKNIKIVNNSIFMKMSYASTTCTKLVKTFLSEVICYLRNVLRKNIVDNTITEQYMCRCNI